MRKVCTAARNACTTNIRTPQRAHCRGPESRHVCSADDGKVRMAGLEPCTLTMDAGGTSGACGRPDSGRGHSRGPQYRRRQGTDGRTRAVRTHEGCTRDDRTPALRSADRRRRAVCIRAAGRLQMQTSAVRPSLPRTSATRTCGLHRARVRMSARVRTSGLRTAGGYGRPSWRGL